MMQLKRVNPNWRFVHSLQLFYSSKPVKKREKRDVCELAMYNNYLIQMTSDILSEH